MTKDGQALGEGLYWYAEKLMWGYEEQVPDRPEAIRLYKQAADLGFADALIRLGEAYEAGNGTEQDTSAALASYMKAAKVGHPLAYGFVGKLLLRTTYRKKAEAAWSAFFDALTGGNERPFVADTAASLVHSYIRLQLRAGLPVRHVETIREHGKAVIGHHQQLLEHAMTDERVEALDGVQNWLIHNLTD